MAADNTPAQSKSKGGKTVEECEAALKRLNLEPADPVFLDKSRVEKGKLLHGDQNVKIATNLFGLKTSLTDVHLYHLHLTKTFPDGKTFPLIQEDDDQKPRNVPDSSCYQSRHLHRKLFDAFVQKYPTVFGTNPQLFCYDYASSLFSLIDLQSYDTPMVLTFQEVKEVADRPFEVKLVLSKPENTVFNIRDVAAPNTTNNVTLQPAHIVRFLEIATSHYAAEHPEDHVMFESKKTYFMHPAEHGFVGIDMGRGKYLAPGASKTVVCIDGPNEMGAVGVVVDSKKTPFYDSKTLLDMVCKALGIQPHENPPDGQNKVFNGYIKGLECIAAYDRQQKAPIRLKEISDETAKTKMLEYNGKNINVAEYFLQRYNITLKYPNWPLAKGGKTVHGSRGEFPLELLIVADNQRVRNGNITPADTAIMVKECAVPPSGKIEEIHKCAHSFSFGADEFMRNAGLEVLNTNLAVEARILKPPQISYATDSMAPEENGKWRLPKAAKFVKCSKASSWCAVFLRVHDERMHLQQFRGFVQQFLNECHGRGLAIQPPANILEIFADKKTVRKVFADADKDGHQFILFGHSDNDKDTAMHDFIKTMEHEYSVISQCIRTKTVENIMKATSRLCLENIVQKTNVKLGGLNYVISVGNCVMDDNVLFIGLAMNHPGTGNASAPVGASGSGKAKKSASENVGNKSDDESTASCSILGFAANDGQNANEYTGNFYLLPKFHDENCSVLDKLLEEILRRFRDNRQKNPSRVVIYLSGCSEGSYGLVLRYEIPIIRFAIKKFADGAPFTVIIPTKAHNLRFFKQKIDSTKRSDAQNIRPGTCIDRVIGSNEFVEFYLNAHLSIQGTAKTPKYTVIYSSEQNPDFDMLQRWTNALCYNFQIVNSPTSFPAPVQIASCYAERGRAIINNTTANSDANIAPVGNNTARNGPTTNGNNYYEKSLPYNYSNKEFLRGKRINA